MRSVSTVSSRLGTPSSDQGAGVSLNLNHLVQAIADAVAEKLNQEAPSKSLRPAGSDPQVSPLKALLKSAEAAKYLGISPRQLTELQTSGKIPSINVGNGKSKKSHRYVVKDLEAWIDANRSCGQAEGE